MENYILRDKDKSLTKKGYPRDAGEIKDILGKHYFREMGFNIPKGSTVSARHAVELKKTRSKSSHLKQI